MKIPRELLSWVGRGHAGGGVPERRRLYLLLGLTALGVPLGAWMWTQMSPGVEPPAPTAQRPSVARAAPPPPPSALGLPQRSPVPAIPEPTLMPSTAAEVRNPKSLPDPFDASDSGGSLKVLERRLRMKEVELKLAQLERQIKDAREGPKAALAPRGSLSSPPAASMPPLPALPLPWLPTLADPAPRPAGPVTAHAPAIQPSAVAPGPPAGSPPPLPLEATAVAAEPQWPAVHLVAVGRIPLAIVQRGDQVVSVGPDAQLGEFVVERITADGVAFRHAPTGKRQLVRVPVAPDTTATPHPPVGRTEKTDTPVKASAGR